MRRQSTLPKVVVRVAGPKPASNTVCVGCGVWVNPGMSYTGSIIIGRGQTSRASQELTGLTYTNCHTDGGYWTRRKGLLCDGCASNYHTIEDRYGNRVPIVITDPRPGFIGQTLIPVKETINPTREPERRFVVSRNSHG